MSQVDRDLLMSHLRRAARIASSELQRVSDYAISVGGLTPDQQKTISDARDVCQTIVEGGR